MKKSKFTGEQIVRPLERRMTSFNDYAVAGLTDYGAKVAD